MASPKLMKLLSGGLDAQQQKLPGLYSHASQHMYLRLRPSALKVYGYNGFMCFSLKAFS